MGGNFPGAGNAVPQVVSEVITKTRGVSVPGGTRLAMIMGEGAREERIIANAVGGGNDGLDPTYSSTTGADGRHFIMGAGEAVAPLIENRSRLFRNGIELTVLEGTIDGSAFDNRFDAKVDTTEARIELQRAALVDQGGAFWSASANNVGDGYINNLSLIDVNAPAETWTVRCSSVRRDGYGVPIDGYARFIARGSVSGILLDGYGNQVIWQSNGTTANNTVLQFNITEGTTAFREGDSFVIQVSGGSLIEGESLSAIYIPVIDINDIELLSDMIAVTAKHGTSSTTNRLSLGCQLAFANAPPAVYTLQTAPALPRRESYTLVESATGDADLDDLSFSLPLNVTPDSNSNINFFVTDATTGVESQIIPNKVDFYDPTITANPSGFVFGVTYDFSYTVILDDSVQKSGIDGVIEVVTGTTGTLASTSADFGQDDLSATRSVRIFNATNATNNGTFTILAVADGKLTLSNGSGFVAETGIQFEVLDSSATSARILWTDDLVLGLGDSLRCTLVDRDDADFFDTGWLNAYESAERVDADIIIPLPSQTISAIFTNGKNHVETQSNIKNKHERVLFIGAIQGLEPENVIGTENAAVENLGILEGIQGDDVTEILAGNVEDLTDYGVQNAYGSTFRVVYFYPDEIVVTIGADNTVIDGFFMAAAAAGFLSGDPNINEPLTNKTLSGFSILRDKLYSPLVIENISAAGIALLQPVAGGGRVIWGKTTTNSGFAEEEEISIVFIRDRIAKVMRAAFEGFIGRAETPTLQATLYARAVGILQSFITQRLITDFRDLIVKRDDVEPRQWNVSVDVQPVFPVNWIYIRVNLGLF
jgi:hypothetical protein